MLLTSSSIREILLNYALFNPSIGYNQGMSDLLASVLSIVQDEVDAFWCFVGLMENSVFVTTPRDDAMDTQLVSARKFSVLYTDFLLCISILDI